MVKVGIAIDDWKLPIFERYLSEGGYAWEQRAGVTDGDLFLFVMARNPEDLAAVVLCANREAARTGKGGA